MIGSILSFYIQVPLKSMEMKQFRCILNNFSIRVPLKYNKVVHLDVRGGLI